MRLALLLIILLSILSGCLTSDGDEPEEILGETTVILRADRKTVRKGESLIGNFLSDVMLYYANKMNWMVDEQPIQFAFINGGSIRITKDKYPENAYPVGNLTNYMLDEMLPFEDTVVLAKITGVQLKQIFEHSVSGLPDGEGFFLQVSSTIRIHFNPKKQKQIISKTGERKIITPGERISSIEIKEGDTFKPYRPDKIYALITNKYIGTGGDGYLVFDNLPSARVLNITLFDMIKEYLKEFSPITPKIEGRLIHEKI